MLFSSPHATPTLAILSTSTAKISAMRRSCKGQVRRNEEASKGQLGLNCAFSSKFLPCAPSDCDTQYCENCFVIIEALCREVPPPYFWEYLRIKIR